MPDFGSLRINVVRSEKIVTLCGHNAAVHFDVAVIGGGVVGWSCAYHILERDPAMRVVVVDSNPAGGMGATGRAAGGVRAQFGTRVNIELSLWSIWVFEEFSKKFGVDIGFRQYGYLLVTGQENGDAYLDRAYALQREIGVPVRRLSKREVEKLAPYLNCSDIISGSFSPTDGYLDPHAVCTGFEASAKALGARTKYSSELLGREGSELVIQATHGIEKLDVTKIVLATGHASAETARRLGLDMPVLAKKRQLAMTGTVDNLPEQLPMVVDVDTTFHFRREGKGLLIGYEDKHASISESLSFDYEFLEHLAEPALHRLPLLAQVGFDTQKCWAGFYAETPDHHAIIGEVNGLVVATGFAGHGVMHSPAAGRAVAEIILDGACTCFDIHPLRPERFAEGDLVVEPMVI